MGLNSFQCFIAARLRANVGHGLELRLRTTRSLRYDPSAMGTQSPSNAAGSTVEMAAGALLWSDESPAALLAVVHRPEPRNDWVLPKGRPEPGETLAATALREVQEETGCMAELRSVAGRYSYVKGGNAKTVVLWHAVLRPGHYATPAGPEEIDQRAWLPPAEAFARLTYPMERAAVVPLSAAASLPPGPLSHLQNQSPNMKTPTTTRRPEAKVPASKRDRFLARLHKTTEEFEVAKTISTAPENRARLDSVGRSLVVAREILAAEDLDGAWGALHDAERALIYAMEPDALVNRAVSLQAECRVKLKDWRRDATEGHFTRANLTELRKPGRVPTAAECRKLEHAVFESLNVLNEHTDNVYHRMRLVGEQLVWLVFICLAVLLAFLLLVWLGARSGPGAVADFSSQALSIVMLAGALGGCASAMYQLSRVGKAKIPEESLNLLITLGRPVVGAAVAIFVYAVICAGLISLKPAGVESNLTAGVLFGFVAGFSERFVLGVIAKAGAAKDDKPDKPRDSES